MKITVEFKKEDLMHLLYSTCMYSFEVNFSRETDEEDKKVSSYEQMVLGLLYNAGMNADIEFDEENNKYNLSDDFTNEMIDMIQDYEDATFWESLCRKLAMRDYFMDAIKEGKVSGHTHHDHDHSQCDHEHDAESDEEVMERVRAIHEIEEKYWKEFQEYGLENLKIEKPNLRIVK